MIVTLCVALLGVPCAPARSTSYAPVADTIRLEVGSAEVNGGVYAPHAARVRVRIGPGDGRLVAEWTNELTLGDSAGRRVMRWVTKGTRYPPTGDTVRWEIRQTYDARTLAPYGYVNSSSTGAFARLTIDGPRIRGTRRIPGDTAVRPVDLVLDRPGFIASASDLVPVAVGLKEGAVMTAPVWGPTMTRSELRIFSVLGQGPVAVEGREVRAWKVEERRHADRALLATWYLTETSPYMVYGEVPLPDGTVQRMTEVEIPRSAPAAPAAAPPAPDTASRMEVIQLADGVFAARRTEPLGLAVNSNSLILVGERDVTVVDAQFTREATLETLAAIRRITPKPVRYVVNTHWHDDHFAGNQVYRDSFPGVEFVMHANTRSDLRSLGAPNRVNTRDGAPPLVEKYDRQLATGLGVDSTPASPDERASVASALRIMRRYLGELPAFRETADGPTVQRRMTLGTGPTAVELRWFGRANTRGDLVVHVPRRGVVATGDLLVAPVPFAFGSYPAEWIAVLDSVAALRPRVIVPGHGEVMRDLAYLRRVRAMLVAVRDQAGAAAARGDSLDAALRAVTLDQHRREVTGGEKWRGYMFERFFLQPAVTAAYRQAKGRRGALAPGALAFVNATVVPMTSDTVLENATVLVAGGRVVAVGHDIAVPAGARRVDARGRYLVPGLADMHTHLYSDDAVPDSAAPAEVGVMLANGVTTARLMIGTPEHLRLRRDVAAGRVLGPQLWIASPQLAGRAFPNGISVTTPDEARAAVRAVADSGYDFVKLTLFITPAVYDAVVDEAAKRRIRVVGHVDPQVGVERALRAGQQIEHLDAYFEAVLADSAPTRMSVTQQFVFNPANWASLDYMDDRKIAAIAGATARARVWSSPTLNVFNSAFAAHESDSAIRSRPDWRMIPPALRKGYLEARARYWAPATAEARSEARRRRYIQVRNSLVKAIHDSGGRILAGSDTPEWFHAYGWGLHRELQALVAAGLTPYQALAAATRNPAELLGQAGEWGTIEPGARADLVLLAANPLADIRNTLRIEGVAVGGRWLSRAERDRLIAAGSAAIGGTPQGDGG